jgi:septum formation protein
MAFPIPAGMGSRTDLTTPPLILASASVYRRALLDRLGLPFAISAPGIDETPLRGESAARAALRLAEAKARAVPASPPALVIGSDQVAELHGEHLGKPGDHLTAVAQLRAMRGEEVIFHTALCLYNSGSGAMQLANIPTTVTFRDLSDAQIERYLRLEQPYDCAGSARVERLGIAVAERIVSDDPTALIGLPLIALVTMLQAEGVAVI